MKEKIALYNFHSHTSRCGHAFGKDEEYIANAIKEGFPYFGMSDHVIFPFLDQPKIRGNYNKDFPSYIQSFKYLKRQYSNQIDLHLGMEAEYSNLLKSYYIDLLKNELEYLILGQHFHMNNDLVFHNYDRYSNPGELYVKDLIEGMESGLFLYVAHPDQLIYYQENNEEFKVLSKRIIEASKRTKTPLEFNYSKVAILEQNGEIDAQEKAIFPVKEFWEIAALEGADVIIGLDTHDPKYVTKDNFLKAYKYATEFHLKILAPEEIINRMRIIKKQNL